LLHSKVTINNAFGLHVRPAAILSARAQKFQSEILFFYSYHIINAKSLMNILSACIRSGSEITIQCTGPDEEQAMQMMRDTIQYGLNVTDPLHFNPASRPPHILDRVSYRKKSVS
jgi:phosphocarrier protein